MDINYSSLRIFAGLINDNLTTWIEMVSIPMTSRSIKSRSRIFEATRKMRTPRMTCESIVGIAHHLNPKLRWWIQYFGKFRGYSLSKVFYVLRIKLVRWARYHYKRYWYSLTKAYKWLDRVREQYPSLFIIGMSDIPIKLIDLYKRSRMTGDCHIRFCEKLGVKLPLSTRQFAVQKPVA